MRSMREWRTDRLRSVRELAGAAGVTHKTLIDIEHGRRRPTYETMRRLSEALGVPAGEIAEFAAVLEERGKDAA
ncbi:MAG: helix-turn-helix domain-containing protein [Chloroflexota bacterium]|nr:helix-turn-helix domain-containing protein [Chloroflexota bacterium]